MTPKQADKIIKAGKPVTFHNSSYNETFTGTPISRNRWDINIQYTTPNNTTQTGIFDRGDLEIINPQ